MRRRSGRDPAARELERHTLSPLVIQADGAAHGHHLQVDAAATLLAPRDYERDFDIQFRDFEDGSSPARQPLLLSLEQLFADSLD